MTRLPLLVAALAICSAVAAPASAAGPAGSFGQLPGSAGCITDDGASNGVAGLCANGRGLVHVEPVVLSPDEKFAYTYGYTSGAISILSRDAATGALSQVDDASACV